MKSCPVATSILYCDNPAHASLAPLRDNIIAPVTATPLMGVMSVGTVGAVVSNVICFVKLCDGVCCPILKNDGLMFLIPSHCVREIGCSEYGNGIINCVAKPLFVSISPFIDTIPAIFAYSAAWICVVFV